MTSNRQLATGISSAPYKAQKNRKVPRPRGPMSSKTERNYKLCRDCRSYAAGSGAARSQQMTLIGARRKAAGEFRRIQQFFHVDARVIAHAFQKIDQVFRGKISARSRAIRAAAESCGAGIEFAHTCFEACKRIRESPAVGVVEV